jgi:hypothetical protein
VVIRGAKPDSRRVVPATNYYSTHERVYQELQRITWATATAVAECNASEMREWFKTTGI